MKKIFEMMGAIAGIGGLALGVFLFLFKDLLSTIIPAAMTPEQSFELVGKFMIFTFAAAFVGMAVWLLAKWAPNRQSFEEYKQHIDDIHEHNTGILRELMDSASKEGAESKFYQDVALAAKQLDEAKKNLDSNVETGRQLAAANDRTLYNKETQRLKKLGKNATNNSTASGGYGSDDLNRRSALTRLRIVTYE